jgi:3-oxoacyl-[acyl-carrier protein] reductase
MEIRDASALVTGAGRGIGRSIALALAREGARLTVVARTAPELDSLIEEIETVGSRGVAFAADLRSPSACDGAVATAVECFGGLQILVNNAGVGVHANVADTTDEDWETVLGTNLTAPIGRRSSGRT